MPQQIRLNVYRRLDNRLEGLDDQSPRGIELHTVRASALHEALDDDPHILIASWGCTDDTKSHELVHLLLEFVSNPAVTGAASAALTWLGSQVLDAFGDVVTDGIKSVIQRLKGQQKADRIRDFTIELPNEVKIRVDPGRDHSTISVSTTPDSVTIKFNELPDPEDAAT